MARTGTILLALALLVVAVGCGSESREPRVPEHVVAAQDKAAKGRALFIQSGCSECHVIDETPQVKEGQDFSYYAHMPTRKGMGSGAGWVSMYVLEPTKPPPPGAPEHPKISDYKTRDAIAKFLTKNCVLEGYERPDRSGPTHYCLVTGLAVSASDPRTASRAHNGRQHYFATDAAAAKFDLNPGHFLKK
jgi:hypothetical protein